MLKIIIPTCGAECLENTLAGLHRYNKPATVETIIVYNGSQGSTGKWLDVCSMYSQFDGFSHRPSRIIAFPYRIGYVRAIDWGWKLADPAPDDYIAVLNDDVVIEGDWITPLVEALQRYPSAQVGPSLRYLGADGLGYADPAFHVPPAYLYLEGWCWMARAETITQAGGIVDLGFDGSYCEDCDLSIRIAESGLLGGRIFEIPAPIRHIGHQSSSPETQAQWAKNRLYLAEKWDLSSGGRRG